jgi:hypothetical protein
MLAPIDLDRWERDLALVTTLANSMKTWTLATIVAKIRTLVLASALKVLVITSARTLEIVVPATVHR